MNTAPPSLSSHAVVFHLNSPGHEGVPQKPNLLRHMSQACLFFEVITKTFGSTGLRALHTGDHDAPQKIHWNHWTEVPK